MSLGISGILVEDARVGPFTEETGGLPRGPTEQRMVAVLLSENEQVAVAVGRIGEYVNTWCAACDGECPFLVEVRPDPLRAQERQSTKAVFIYVSAPPGMVGADFEEDLERLMEFVVRQNRLH